MISRGLWLICFCVFAIWWPLLVLLTRPFRDNLLNFQVIINQFTQSVMFFVIYSNILEKYDDTFSRRIYYNNLMIIAFALWFSSIRTFLVIVYRIGSYAKNSVFTLFPYFKFYCIRSIRTLRKFLNWICTINWKKRRRLRQLRKKFKVTAKKPATLMQTSTTDQLLETNNPMSLNSDQLEFIYEPKSQVAQLKINSSIVNLKINESDLEDY